MAPGWSASSPDATWSARSPATTRASLPTCATTWRSTAATGDVTGGVVTIRDAFDNATDLHVATVLAEAVPGVTLVHVETREAQ